MKLLRLIPLAVAVTVTSAAFADTPKTSNAPSDKKGAPADSGKKATPPPPTKNKTTTDKGAK